jgi:hypothetical protein
MTTARASAYRRVMRTLRDMGPAKLWEHEQDCIRTAADTLLFCRSFDDEEPSLAIVSVTALVDCLVDSERWTRPRAEQLLDDVWDCGPEADCDTAAAA